MTAKLYKLIPLNQILLILMGILVVYLMVDFGRQMGVSRQRREELDQIEQKIDMTLAERGDLENQLGGATSPEAVEAWARRNGLTRENEVLVVFLGGPTGPTTSGDESSSRADSGQSPRDAWLALFFGRR